MNDSLARVLQALGQGSRRIPDVVVLDPGLSDPDSIGIIRRLQTWTKAPVIVLSIRADSTGIAEEWSQAGQSPYQRTPDG